MVTIITSGHGKYKVNGSEFLGYLFKVPTRDVFESELKTIKNDHHSATHHCYAWCIGLSDVQEYSQDDGEPAGTAGLPILNQMRSAELINAGLIVVRYYGGTPLGKPGLIDAYGITARLTIEDAGLAVVMPTHLFRIEYRYEHQNLIEKWKHTFGLIEKEAQYLETVTLTVACPTGFSKPFMSELKFNEHLPLFFNKLGDSLEIKSRF